MALVSDQYANFSTTNVGYLRSYTTILMSDTMDPVSTLSALQSSVHTAYGALLRRTHADARRRMLSSICAECCVRRRTVTQCVNAAVEINVLDYSVTVHSVIRV